MLEVQHYFECLHSGPVSNVQTRIVFNVVNDLSSACWNSYSRDDFVVKFIRQR